VALREALDELEAVGDRVGAIQACLAMAESYLPSGQGKSVIHWVNRALADFGAQFDPEAQARAYYLLGAGQVQAGTPLEEAGTHLEKAASLSDENNLPEMAARSRFELGNLLAQRGDLAGALGAFEKTLALAQVAGARFLEILGHNNLAYHAHLAGDLDTAREHIQAGLALAEAHGLFIPRQYLYSTRGEIALAEGQPDEAQDWFRRGLVEAEKNNNQLMAANIRANLGLAARAQGNLDRALIRLEEAQHAAAAISAPHLQTQIDLWLAELHLQRGERAAARAALARADGRLAGSERRGLQIWAEQVRAALEG
jgi:tetratricopeptide (TPR) repeat protein